MYAVLICSLLLGSACADDAHRGLKPAVNNSNRNGTATKISQCEDGYQSTVGGNCNPICDKPCINAECVAPNVCRCKPGYQIDEHNWQCSPQCIKGCEPDGRCISPNVCEYPSTAKPAFSLNPNVKVPKGKIQGVNPGIPTYLNTPTNQNRINSTISQDLARNPVYPENHVFPENQIYPQNQGQPSHGYPGNQRQPNHRYPSWVQSDNENRPVIQIEPKNPECVSCDGPKHPWHHHHHQHHHHHHILPKLKNILGSHILPNHKVFIEDLDNQDSDDQGQYHHGPFNADSESASQENFMKQPLFHCSQPCINGICVEDNKCSCNLGYEPDAYDSNRCVPSCQDCSNGICLSPYYCKCNFGYEKRKNAEGRRVCMKMK